MKKAIALLTALLLVTLAACGEAPAAPQPQTETVEPQPEAAEPAEAQPETAEDADLPPDFELADQYGVTHRLSDCRGKVVFLNFWATWCPYCIKEMSDIQALYETYGEDVAVFGVAAPGKGSETDEEGIRAFLEEHGWTYPTLMDPGDSVAKTYGVTSLPTTFLFAKDGTVFGYVPGAMRADQMQSAVEQALAAE